MAPLPSDRWLIPLSDAAAVSRLHIILDRILNLFPTRNRTNQTVICPEKVIQCIASATTGFSSKLHLITSALPISYDTTEKENAGFLSHAPVSVSLKSPCSPAEKLLLCKFDQLAQLCREKGLCLNVILNDIVSETQNKGCSRALSLAHRVNLIS